jgi:hypothetical protein
MDARRSATRQGALLVLFLSSHVVPARAHGGVPRAIAIAQAPGDPNRIAVQSDAWGLFLSLDGGTTFAWLCPELFDGEALGLDHPTVTMTPDGPPARGARAAGAAAFHGGWVRLGSVGIRQFRSGTRSRAASRRDGALDRGASAWPRRRRRAHRSSANATTHAGVPAALGDAAGTFPGGSAGSCSRRPRPGVTGGPVRVPCRRSPGRGRRRTRCTSCCQRRGGSWCSPTRVRPCALPRRA